MTDTTRLRATHLKSVFDGQGRQLKWLSKRVDLSEPFMSRVISGERTIGADKAQLIAEALGVPLFLLFEATDVAHMAASRNEMEVA